MEQHPEHIDVMIGIATIFHDQRQGSREFTREEAQNWLSNEVAAESYRGFKDQAFGGQFVLPTSLKEQ